jgi:hypothetical protein
MLVAVSHVNVAKHGTKHGLANHEYHSRGETDHMGWTLSRRRVQVQVQVVTVSASES